MSKTSFGTDTITGLNVGTASHKISPSELQLSENGWTDKDGAWTVAKGPTTEYSGYSDISCFAAGRMSGADHLVWMDGNTLYDNGTSAGTITAGASMKILALDDKFLILGAAKNYIYDGDHVREQGCWQPEEIKMRLVRWQPTDQSTITGITSANPGVVSMTAHELETGDYVYLDDLTEMTELNGRKFLVTRIDANSFSINEDTSGYTAETSSTGTYNRKAGLEGVYRWYITCTVTLDGGRVLESRPRGLRLSSTDDSRTSWEAEDITMRQEDGIYIGGTDFSQVWWNQDSEDYFSISGTRGTDFMPGLRIYRTKADGTDFYLEREYTHGDANFTYLAGGTSSIYYLDHVGASNYGAVLGADDIELGAVYTATSTDHSNPPVSSLAVTVGQRLFINDASNPDRYYWSHFDGIEYYNPLSWNTVKDAITEMSALGRELVLWSQDRLWVDRMTGGVPDQREIRTDTGATPGDVTTTTDDGVLLLSGDGLWLFDGATVTKISRRGFSEITSPASICATGDTVYMSGSADSYVVRQRDGGMVWHGGEAVYPLSDTTGGEFYGASTNAIVKMFNGSRQGGKLKTMDFVIGAEAQIDMVRIDLEGTSVPTVWVNGNRQSDSAPHAAEGVDEPGARRMIWVRIPRLSNHVASVTLESTGDCTVYGVWMEAMA